MSILKSISFVILALLLLLIAGVLYLVLNNSNETMTYQQSDFINYHVLTEKDIANAPRITRDFYFEPSPGEGYPPTSSIIYKKAPGVNSLDEHILSLGLKKENRTLGANYVWSKPDDLSGNLFYVSFDPVNKDVTLTKSIGR